MENKNITISQVEEDKNIPAKKVWYRAKELSQHFGISEAVIWKYAKLDIITAYKFGGRVTVFNIDEVEDTLLTKRGVE